MNLLRKSGDAITTLNHKIFNVALWVIYPLVAVVMYEVIKRYIFLSPTNWVYDMTWMLFGTFTFLGGAYCLHINGHVKADIFWQLLPPKGRAAVDLISYVVFFFPVMILLTYSSFNYFLKSFLMNETSPNTNWRPELWPWKLIMLISVIILLLQGIVEFWSAIKPLFEKKKEADES